MRRICLGIAGIVVVASLASCGDTGVQEGAVPFKGTPTEPFKAMTNEMKKNAKAQAEAKKPEGDAKTTAEAKPAEAKPAEAKPAETKPAETKPAETKPAETKPAETKPKSP